MDSPCKLCEQHTPDCHGKCDTYLNYTVLQREETIHKNKQLAALGKMYDYGGKWRRYTYTRRKKR